MILLNMNLDQKMLLKNLYKDKCKVLKKVRPDKFVKYACNSSISIQFFVTYDYYMKINRTHEI